MMFAKGIAIVSINQQGVAVATKIHSALKQHGMESTVYAPQVCLPDSAKPVEAPFSKFIQQLFRKVDAIVAVMAVGIIIRAIAPCLKNKLADPAVVCVDIAGKSAVSLLSGHFGLGRIRPSGSRRSRTVPPMQHKKPVCTRSRQHGSSQR
jgi:cobalt-precorrin 5A hydrolase